MQDLTQFKSLSDLLNFLLDPHVEGLSFESCTPETLSAVAEMQAEAA